MTHEFDIEKIDYESSNYELDVWSSCFNPIFNPPPSVIEEWNHRMVDDWDEPEPELQDTAVYFTDDGIEYLLVGKTMIPITEHFADNGKTVRDVIENVIHYAAKKTEKVKSSLQATKLKTTPAYSTMRVRSIVSVGCFTEGGFNEATVQYRTILQIKP